MTKRKRQYHGLTGERLYRIYSGMIKRCLNKNDSNYPRYGGRGITVCEEWLDDVKCFYKWALSNGYDSKLSIDRIDNNKGYYPENCRWTTMIVQQNNKSNNVFVEIRGKRMTIAQCARKYKIPVVTLRRRFKQGDRNEQLIRDIDNTAKEKNILFNGENKTMKEIVALSKVAKMSIWRRIEKGYKDDDLLLSTKEFKDKYPNEYHKKGKESRLISIGSEQKTVKEWSMESNVSEMTIYSRIRKGYKGEDLLMSPKEFKKKYNTYSLGKRSYKKNT